MSLFGLMLPNNNACLENSIYYQLSEKKLFIQKNGKIHYPFLLLLEKQAYLICHSC